MLYNKQGTKGESFNGERIGYSQPACVWGIKHRAYFGGKTLMRQQ